MIGCTDWFMDTFGGTPDGAISYNARIALAMVRTGLGVIVIEPRGKKAACTLTAAQRSKADREAQKRAAERGSANAHRVFHDCGSCHAITTESGLRAVAVGGKNKRESDGHITRIPGLLDQGANLAIGLGKGARRLIVVDVDTSEQRDAFASEWMRRDGLDTMLPMTVSSPGVLDDGTWKHKNGGHYWFNVPDDFELPDAGIKHTGEGGWVAYWNTGYVLVPPSVRPEGAYRVTGTAYDMPIWLGELISEQGERTQAGLLSERLRAPGDTIDEWASRVSWAEILAPDGWAEESSDSCGCPTFTRPGDAVHAKSATAHEAGCSRYDTTMGHGPLHIWSDAVDVGGSKTVSKLTYLAWRDHEGDNAAAMEALGIEKSGRSDDDLTDIIGGEHPKERARASAKASKAKADADESAGRQLRITRASEIAIKPTHWAWAGRIPIGSLILIAGREGTGKSTVMYDLAAKMTLGELDGSFKGDPRTVVVSAFEDSWAQTIVPRLVAAGADLHRVVRIDAVDVAGSEVQMSLPRDVADLKDICAAEQVGMVLLDPLMSALDASMKGNDYQAVYHALLPIVRLAETASIAVVGVTHFNKTTEGDPLTRIMGNRAFATTVRGVLVVHSDKGGDDDPLDDQGPPVEHFLLGHAKNNLGRKLPTLLYSLEGVHVADTDDGPVYAPQIVWEGETDRTVEAAMVEESRPGSQRGTAKDAAKAWLSGAMSDGLWHVAGDVKSAAELEGHAPRTVQRALKELGGQAQQAGAARVWYWIVPVRGRSELPELPSVTVETDITVERVG
jgi:hypothetical protein